MTLTDDFQRDVSLKLNAYFERKILALHRDDPQSYFSIKTEYERQLSLIQETREDHRLNLNAIDFDRSWLSCLSEPITEYNLADLTYRTEDNDTSIYSPRIDIAITPTVIKNRSSIISLGVYRLAHDVSLFNIIHRLDFIWELENTLREISNLNLRENNLEPPATVEYINTRPMHLFGIEIENQKNPKHLMGDFLNAISLSKIPIIIFPEDKFMGCIKMLLFSTTIKNLKEVPIYDILSKAIFLKIDQFRTAINRLLIAED
ncbi:hypothetical protein D3C71_999850 [compost metagenome]